MRDSQVVVWGMAGALALWLAWQNQQDLTSPSVAVPLVTLIAIGIWHRCQSKK